MKLKIRVQGAPIVNLENLHITKQYNDTILAQIDMRSKWCAVGSLFNFNDDSFGFDLEATDRSTNLNPDKDRNSYTEIEIEDMPGWEIFLVDCQRYTIKLVLVRKEEAVTVP